MDKNKVTVKVLNGCARCNGIHVDIDFKMFTFYPQFAGNDGAMFTHWAMCPETNEPILMRIEQDHDG